MSTGKRALGYSSVAAILVQFQVADLFCECLCGGAMERVLRKGDISMICSACGKEPLTKQRYIWKPQAVTLTCSQCNTDLRMSPATERLAVLLILAASLAMGMLMILLLSSVPQSFWNEPSPTVLVAGFAVLIFCCVGLAYLVRTVLWTKPYVRKAGQ
jgi:hypothetical protein